MPHLGRLALAAATGAGILLWAVLADQARALVRAFAADGYATVLAIALSVAVLVALLAASAAIRRRRDRSRAFLLLGAALAIGIAYAQVTATGEGDVDAAERIHFIQYGVLTWVCYRAWLPAGDRSTLVAPVLAALLVGTLDEWVQWLVPYRVGELRDVLLNAAAVACGLLFSVALDPPSPSRGLRPDSRAWVFGLAAAAWVVLCLFFSSVQVGYEVTAADGSRFLSTLSPSELASAGRDRADRWRGMRSPQLAKRFSVEDRYLTEGLWHVQARNQKLNERKPADAWSENRILEEFYSPVLDRPISGTPAGSRWPPDHPAVSASARADVYVSTANLFPLYPWPKWIFWALAIVGGAALARAGIICR